MARKWNSSDKPETIDLDDRFGSEVKTFASVTEGGVKKREVSEFCLKCFDPQTEFEIGKAEGLADNSVEVETKTQRDREYVKQTKKKKTWIGKSGLENNELDT